MQNCIINEREQLWTALLFVFSLPRPTHNNANLSPAKGEQTDTYLQVKSETKNDEEVNSF